MKASVLVRIATDPPARLWNGIGDLEIPPDIVEPATATYLGGGALVSVPDLEVLINATAARYDLTLSGVNAETLKLAQEEAASFKGAATHIGIVYFNDDWSVREVEWVAVIRGDSITTANQPSEGGRTRSISPSFGTENTDRSRAPIALWTDADQRRMSPTDRFYDHKAGISSGTSRRFGPSS